MTFCSPRDNLTRAIETSAGSARQVRSSAELSATVPMARSAAASPTALPSAHRTENTAFTHNAATSQQTFSWHVN